MADLFAEALATSATARQVSIAPNQGAGYRHSEAGQTEQPTMRDHPRGAADQKACIVSDLVRQITGWIASARFPLHSRLPPERELAVLLQTSRARVRDALKVLEDGGRIWRRVGMGTFVGSRPRSTRSLPESLGAATTLSEILEARSLIEPVVARLAAQRAERADIAMIEQYSLAANKAQTWAKWERWDELLHRAIVEASGNGILINTVDHLLRIKLHSKWTVQQAVEFDPALTARYGREHRAVISCIIGRDGEGAEAAMRRHMLGLSLTVGPAITRAARGGDAKQRS